MSRIDKVLLVLFVTMVILCSIICHKMSVPVPWDNKPALNKIHELYTEIDDLKMFSEGLETSMIIAYVSRYDFGCEIPDSPQELEAQANHISLVLNEKADRLRAKLDKICVDIHGAER